MPEISRANLRPDARKVLAVLDMYFSDYLRIKGVKPDAVHLSSGQTTVINRAAEKNGQHLSDGLTYCGVEMVPYERG